MTATKIQPGNDTHLTLLMAPHSLNFVTGADRAALLAYGRDVFAAGREAKCLAQIQEPAQPVCWIRFCSDGSTEGPIMHSQICEARKTSGAWTPLYAGAAPAAVAGPADEREAFEAWARDKTDWKPNLERKGDGYVGGFAQTAWEGWRGRGAAPALEAPAAPAYRAEMGIAGRDYLQRKLGYDPDLPFAWADLYAAMLAAAPQAQAEAQAAPVAGQCRFKGEQAWGNCSVEHVRMILQNPSKWQSYEVRYLYAAPQAPAAPVALPPRAKFDAMTAEQEEMAVNFCAEIAGPKGQAGRNPDPVRLLEMAEALYHADAAFVDLPSPAVSDQEIAVRMNRSACQKYPNDINLRIAHNVGWRAARDVLAAPAAPAVDAETIHLQDLKNALAECKELRQQLTLMDEHQAGTVWRWQADAQDKIETMGNRMGVLIYACDLRALLAGAAPAVDALAPVQALLDMHAELLDANPYAYFELAYTRQTGWMAWITDKPMYGAQLINPERKVLARGQGDTPAEACAAAAQAKEGGVAA